MTKALNLRRHSGGRIVAGRVSSTVVQNQFGVVLDRVAREGVVEITKHNRTYAVLLSAHAFQQLTMPSEPSMERLAVEIGALLDRMQTPEAKTAVDTLFAMGEAELGAAAVQQAREARHVAPAPSRKVTGLGKIKAGPVKELSPSNLKSGRPGSHHVTGIRKNGFAAGKQMEVADVKIALTRLGLGQGESGKPMATVRKVPSAKLLPSNGKPPKAGAPVQPAPRSGVARKRTRRRVG